MKTRVISAAVLVPILFLIVLVAPVSAAAVILGMLLAIAAYELLYRTGLVKQPRLVIYSSVMAFAISMWSYFEAARAYFVLLLMAFFMVMLAEMMRDHIKVRFETVSMCFVGVRDVPPFPGARGRNSVRTHKSSPCSPQCPDGYRACVR